MNMISLKMDEQVFTNDLQVRLLCFAVNVIRQVRILPKGKEYDVITWQIIKSSSSCGANYAEAQSAVSRDDFANKTGIALKEIKESNYWIKLILEITKERNDWHKLYDESAELMRILGSIYKKTSRPR